jgi:hypothetical protein
MTEYGRERERRRARRSALAALHLLAMTALLGLRTGWLPAVTALVALTSAVYLVPALVIWRGRRAEAERRAGGAPPSWPAQLPVAAAQRLGLRARHSARAEAGELSGRLSLTEDGLRWEPRESDRRRGAAAIVWDASWSAEIVPLWGPGDQGCLSLSRPDGTAVDVWIRHPADLRRVLGRAAAV